MNMEATNLKITKKYYTKECDDDCRCFEDGYEWYVNGEYIYRSPCEDTGWMEVLKHLGFSVTLVGTDDKNEEVWEL